MTPAAGANPTSNTPSGPPSFRLLRYEEEYQGSALNAASELWRSLKYIPLGSGTAEPFVSVGGEVRWQYIVKDDDQFGRIPGSQESLQQRYLLHSDFELSPRFRVFGQLGSAWEQGKKPAALPVDEDRLDAQQLFAELSFAGDIKARKNYIRVGRQEILLGGHQLLKVREGPNVRLAFDAARVHATEGAFDADLFCGTAVQPRPGSMDDRWLERTIEFSGVNVGWQQARAQSLLRSDVFFFDYRNSFLRYEQASGPEHRQTVGARISGHLGSLDFDYEASKQFGRLGTLEIDAWGTALFTSYHWEKAMLVPKLTFGLSYVTGDRDRADREINTFNCLFARGDYFGDTSLLTGANTLDAGAAIELNPARRFCVSCQWDFLWRSEISDGLYAPPQIYFRDGRAKDDRFIGLQLTLSGTWVASRFLTLQAIGAVFLAGDFIRHGTPNNGTSALTFRSQFKF